MNRNIKYFLKLLLISTLVFFAKQNAFAADVSLTIRDADSIVFSGTIPFPSNISSLNDSSGTPHEINPSSVLAILASADETSTDFSISNLQYFDSFNSLYLKCITDTNGEKCDDWQYVVNETYPGTGMDQNILSGGENIYVYFGPQNRVQLSSSNINTNDNLTITAEKYDYQNNAWITRNGVTVGITQPDPNNPFSPTEIKTSPVDGDGKANFSSIPAGSYNVGIKEDYYFPTVPLEVTNPPSSGGGGGSTGGAGASCCVSYTTVQNISTPTVNKKTFDIEKAFKFLLSQQKENGSFGEDLYTDWVALALASGNYQNQTIKLIKYYNEAKFESTLLTDYERRAMSLMALGLNPYNTNNQNYIEKIINSFDGKQFGDINEDNDDIFALIVLQNAGYTKEDKIINDDIAFILKRQKENGSWDESVDMTGAAIEALSVFNEKEEVKNALDKAKNYLKTNQKEDGGWGNSFSTSWALEGILAMNEKGEEWEKNDPTKYDINNSPLDYFATIQDNDGGIKNENIQNKIWETAYAIPVLSNKNWNQLMQKFEKQETKPIVKVVKKNSNKKILTANVINAVSIPPTENKIEIPRKSWFTRFFENIWSAF